MDDVVRVAVSLAGVLSREVVVFGEDCHVKYTVQVHEISQDPDLEIALKALS